MAAALLLGGWRGILNPKLKVLLLHGGPGETHQYFEVLHSFSPGAGIEYYYYEMSILLPKGQYLFSPSGSHLAMYDDQQVYMDGLIRFLKDVETGKQSGE